MDQPEVVVGIGGAAGDGVASAGNTLALSVARQKSNSPAMKCADDISVRRLAEGSRDGAFFDIFERFHRVQSASTNDSYLDFRHFLHSSKRSTDQQSSVISHRS